MTCDSCKTLYKIGIEWEGPRRTKHLCFRCGGKYIPTVLDAMKTHAVNKLIDNFSSKVKSMLGLIIIGIFLTGCFHVLPIIDRRNESTPIPPCQLVPSLAGECKDIQSTRVERFYQELTDAKKQFPTRTWPIQDQK